MKAALAVFVCATAVVLPAAYAQANSALDQYVEEVPDPIGGKDDDGGKKGTVDPERARQLSSRGEAGQALLALAATSGPVVEDEEGSAVGNDAGGNSGQSGGGTGGADADPGVTDLARDGNSLQSAAVVSGVSLPLFIFVLLLAAGMGVTAWLRRSRGDEQ